MEIEHIPVMVEEVLSFFHGVRLQVFCDATVGLGGHAKRILQLHPEVNCYIAMDRDPEALTKAKETLSPWKGVIRYIQSNFADMDKVFCDLGVKQVNGFFLI